MTAQRAASTRRTTRLPAWIGAALLASTALTGVLAAETPGVGAPVGRLGPRPEPVDLTAYAAVRYLSPAGSDTRGDGSRQKPWASLRKALSAAGEAAPGRRWAVLVAAGTYRERDLRLVPHVDLFGSFSGSDWRRGSEPSSILDAERRGQILEGANDATVDGFVLRGGRSRTPGGAVVCNHTSPTLTNNVFTDNGTLLPEGYLRGVLHQIGTDGGAVACQNYASPRIERNLFLANTTEIGGGAAIGMRSQSVRPAAEIPPPVVRHNVFVLNRSALGDTDPDVKKRFRSSNGGAIALSNYLAIIEENLFVQNDASGNSDGGGIYCEYEASATIRRNHFVGNRGEDDGGAIYAMKLSEPLIEGNLFSGNRGGGTIRLSKEGRGRILGNLFFDNPGGGAYAANSWMLLEGNVIAGNGSSGTAVDNRLATYFRPSILRRNRIYGNAGQPFLLEGDQASEYAVITDNEVVAPAGGSAPQPPTEGGPAEFDPRTGQSRIALSGSGAAPFTVGDVIRCGDRWGVVAAADGRRVTAWGDLRPTEPAAARSYFAPGKGLPLPAPVAAPR
jgi:hypothetical protein